jgi:hypothetical protein
MSDILAKADKDESLRVELLDKSKDWWIEYMSLYVRDNINCKYEAEFMIWDFLDYMLSCILYTKPIGSLNLQRPFLEALHYSIQLMFGSAPLFEAEDKDIADRELDVLMSLLDFPVHERAVVLCEHILNGRVKFVYRRHQLILALAQHPDKKISYEYLGKLSALCRTKYRFYLDDAILHQYPFESLRDDHELMKHIIKGYAKGQPLAQFVAEVFSKGVHLPEEEDEETPDDSSYHFMSVNLFLLPHGTLIHQPVEFCERPKILDTLSSLLKEGFLDEQDFFGVPVSIYGTDNVECHEWFGGHFGGYKRFYELWVESSRRNANKDHDERHLLPPQLKELK